MPDIIYPEIVPEDFKNRWIENLPGDKYHADKTAISSTLLKPMDESPFAFLYNWKKAQEYQAPDRKVAKHFHIGHALHMALLEPQLFQASYVIEPEFEGKTLEGKTSKSKSCAENQEQYDAWRASLPPGAVILKASELNNLTDMVNSVLSHTSACTLLKEGVPEISGYYRDPRTGIKCRIRPDFFNFKLNALIDVKTTKNCTKRAFRNEIARYNYQMQTGMYWDGSGQINGAFPDNCAFIAVQNTAPFEVCVYEADPSIIEKGYENYRKAMDKLLTCLTEKRWPRIQEEIEYISLPNWAIQEKDEEEPV